jgi:hypothetical protein
MERFEHLSGSACRPQSVTRGWHARAVRSPQRKTSASVGSRSRTAPVQVMGAGRYVISPRNIRCHPRRRYPIHLCLPPVAQPERPCQPLLVSGWRCYLPSSRLALDRWTAPAQSLRIGLFPCRNARKRGEGRPGLSRLPHLPQSWCPLLPEVLYTHPG